MTGPWNIFILHASRQISEVIDRYLISFCFVPSHVLNGLQTILLQRQIHQTPPFSTKPSVTIPRFFSKDSINLLQPKKCRGKRNFEAGYTLTLNLVLHTLVLTIWAQHNTTLPSKTLNKNLYTVPAEQRAEHLPHLHDLYWFTLPSTPWNGEGKLDQENMNRLANDAWGMGSVAIVTVGCFKFMCLPTCGMYIIYVYNEQE